jgi:quercetin dioxygenase-like cupin family protein
MPTPTTPESWDQIPREKMNELVTRQVFHGDTMTIARLELRQGAFVPIHSHSNEQISMITDGALEFELDGQKLVVRAGEMLQIPGNVLHSALALQDSVAVDVFSPVREDWRRGDDAYLRGR